MIKRALLILFAIIEFCLTARVGAQEFPMLHFTKEDGLPSNTIYSIYRDSKGFLWIATDKGIAIYNGVKFDKYTMADGLPDNEIFFFREDYFGRLWLASFNGELCFYKDGVFHNAANTPFLNKNIKISHIWSMANQIDSSIIIVYNSFNAFVEVKGEKLKVINIANPDSIIMVITYIDKISDARYKLICEDKTVIVDTSGRIFEVHPLKLQYNDVLERLIGGQDQFYFSSKKNTYSFDLSHVIRKNTIDYSHSDINSIYFDKKAFFYATSTGLYFNDTFHVLSGENVSVVTQNEQQNYWVGTIGNGIYVLEKDFLKTKFYGNCYNGEAKFAYAGIHNVFFVNSNNDLFRLTNNQVKCIFNTKKSLKNKFQYDSYSGYCIDSSYRLFGTYGTLFMVIDNIWDKKLKIRFFHLSIRSQSLLNNNNMIYLKPSRTICTFSYKTELFNSDTVKYNSWKLFNEKIFGFAKAPDNGIWCSTISNMYKFSGDNQIDIPQPQFNNKVLKYIYFIGKYMMGYTHDNQFLICENYNGKSIEIDTLPSQNCIWEKFYEIDSLHILISTNNQYRLLTIDGNRKVEPSVTTIENPFIPLDAETVCSDGNECYFFVKGSVISVNVKTLFGKPDPPKLFFTTLKAGKKQYRIHSVLEIPFSESRNMSISYSTLSFGGKDVSYQYSASPVNDSDSWRDIKGEEINLVQPGYGTYAIKIRAKTFSSTWCSPRVFTLHIFRPFWATWWFISLCICAVTIIAGLSIRLRFRYMVRKNRKEHDNEVKFLKSEFKALNALMNPHFIFNTLNNVQSLFNSNDKLAANEYLRIFADLIRQNMQNVSKELITLQKEMALVMNYLMLEKLRFEDKLDYEFNINENIDLSEIMVPPLLIQPLVENAIKHGIFPLKGKSGIVQVNMHTHENTLFIEVRDNGVGLSKATGGNEPAHESFGLQNIRRRIQHLSVIQNKSISLSFGEINDDAGNHLWTVVTISIPLSN